MGHSLSKVLFVDPNGFGPNVYPTIPQAIAASQAGDTIIIASGIYHLEKFVTAAYTKILGLEGVIIRTKHICCPNTSIQNIIFNNIDDCCILISDSPDFMFQNTEIRCKTKNKFGLRLKRSSGVFYNPLLCFSGINNGTFQPITAKDCKYLQFQSPIIRITHQNIKRLETLVVINSELGCSSRIELFSTSLQYKTTGCCHSCVRLIKSCGDVNSVIMNTHINFVGGKGVFDMSESSFITYINSIVINSDSPWEMGAYTNLLLNGFISNLIGACNIQQSTCPPNPCPPCPPCPPIPRPPIPLPNPVPLPCNSCNGGPYYGQQ